MDHLPISLEYLKHQVSIFTIIDFFYLMYENITNVYQYQHQNLSPLILLASCKSRVIMVTLLA
jgi:hypothetical protein